MNTKINHLSKALVLVASLLVSVSVLGQFLDFIPGDVNYGITLEFHKPDTILVVSPDSYLLTRDDIKEIETYVFWEQYQKKPIYTYKNECELTQEDMTKHIQFYGPFNQFKSIEFQKIPVKQHQEGFVFQDIIFSKANDAFFYISEDAMRLYTCKNSSQAANHYIAIGAGYYQIYVFSGDELMFTGFNSAKESINKSNDLQSIRESYFTSVSTKYFDFEIATTLNVDSLKEIIQREMDLFIDSLCIYLSIEGNGLEKIKTYIYANREDLQKFIAASPDFTVYGKSIGTVNHLSSFDISLFRHETSHAVINQLVGINPNTFFMEGFAVCTEYYFDDRAYKNDLKKVNENPEFLTYDLIYSTHNFYDDIEHYPIAGAFTKFLIDEVGITEFKKAYAKNQVEDFLEDQTGKNMEQLIKLFMDYSELAE